jgi:uncharacterized protein (DUF983 family)
MSIYNCPHCGKKSFNPWTKAFAGQLNSYGKPCQECGRRVVNGKAATIFNAVYSTLAIAALIVIYLLGDVKYNERFPFIHHYGFLINIGLFLSILLVPRLVNAFCFPLDKAIKIDLNRR